MRLIRRLSRASVLASALFSPAVAAQQRPTARDFGALETYVDSIRRQAEIPGMAVLIVRDDSILFMKGFGVRELGKPAPVDAQTLFAIGSNSKSFTSAVIGMLVDEGKMRWDAPIVTYLPGFQLQDPYVSRNVTIRDALTHRTGLSRNDALWTNGMYDRNEIIRRLRYAPMEGAFRGSFLYNNMMFLTAGTAAGAAAGSTWDALVQQRIFAPLGMTSSSTSATALTKGGDVAAPHQRVDGAMKKVPVLNADPVAPAGSIVSNLQDMSRWIRMQIAGGRFDGKQLISPASLAEIRKPQNIMQDSPSEGVTAYGFGWVIQEYSGHRIVWHNGGVDGFLSEQRLIPDQKVGWVILTNSFSHNVDPGISNHIADMFLGAPPVRERVAAGAGGGGAGGRGGRGGADAGPNPDARASVPLAQYAGTYSDSLYGDMTVTLSGDALTVKYANVAPATLTHWQYDTFRIDWGTVIRPTSLATFALDARGVPTLLNVAGLTTFKRVAVRRGAGPSSP